MCVDQMIHRSLIGPERIACDDGEQALIAAELRAQFEMEQYERLRDCRSKRRAYWIALKRRVIA